jgi:aspartate/glutamate racemase
VKEKKIQKRYDEEFKRQAVELVIHSGKTQAQIARELHSCKPGFTEEATRERFYTTIVSLVGSY